jgi:hypothetical protein
MKPSQSNSGSISRSPEPLVFDVETDKDGKLLFCGVYNGKRVRYFYDKRSFWDFVMLTKPGSVYAYNLEFDFFKIWDQATVKFWSYYNSAGLSFIRVGNCYFKDLWAHLPIGLKKIGKIMGLEKKVIDYKTMGLTKKALDYNKRDLEITWRLLRVLTKIYQKFGGRKVKASTGGNAFEIFTHNYYCERFRKIPSWALEDWRLTYKGGFVNAFQKGTFNRGPFYKIDVNSLFPFSMYFRYPVPYIFYLSATPDTPFWIAKRGESVIDYYQCDGVPPEADFFYCFPVTWFPFRQYLKLFYKKKQEAKNPLEREVYKRLLNSLYGKFAAKGNNMVLSTQPMKGAHFVEEIQPGLFRNLLEMPPGYWVNIIYSSITTSRANFYMNRMVNYIQNRGLTVYYQDTDGLIVSGDLDRIKDIISSTTLGLFKVEGIAKSIEILGKKMYRFGDDYKCKGVPEPYRKEFFESGQVKMKRMVKYRDSLRRGLETGTWEEICKHNVVNRSEQQQPLNIGA